jgi:hypothetical protein
MKRFLEVLLLVLASSSPIGCSESKGGTDGETHFLCSSDPGTHYATLADCEAHCTSSCSEVRGSDGGSGKSTSGGGSGLSADGRARGGHDAGSGVESGAAHIPAADASTYPAFRPSMPQIVKGGTLPVIAKPVLVPVYFSGDSNQKDIDANLATWAKSESASALAEYGVGSVSTGTSIVVSETPAASLTAPAIETWLAGKLDGTHPEFGAVDATTLASKVFVVFFPPGSDVKYTGFDQCQGGYNAGVTLVSGAAVNYVAVAECGTPPAGVSPADAFTVPAVGNGIWAILSPDPDQQLWPSNFEFYDGAHGAFGSPGLFMCSLEQASLTGSATVGIANLTWDPALRPPPGVWLRMWSNQAAAAYHDPCVPAPSGPYFVSVPVVNDQVDVKLGGTPAPGILDFSQGTTTGVLVPVGGNKTIDVELLSDGPTSGAWTVSAGSAYGTGFTLAFDKTTGQNGDVLHLTITAPSNAQEDVVAIYSTLDKRQTFSVFAVQSK